MTQLLLQAGCHPFTGNALRTMNRTTNASLLTAIVRGCAVINDTSVPLYLDIIESDDYKHKDTDKGAVLYIVVVLIFYSAGIVIMIIKYLRREQREMEEEKALDDFFRSMPAYKKDREQNNVNRVAIQAFHALTTSFSHDDVDEEDAFTDEEEARFFTETIHEVDDDAHETTRNLYIASDKLAMIKHPIVEEVIQTETTAVMESVC